MSSDVVVAPPKRTPLDIFKQALAQYPRHRPVLHFQQTDSNEFSRAPRQARTSSVVEPENEQRPTGYLARSFWDKQRRRCTSSLVGLFIVAFHVFWFPVVSGFSVLTVSVQQGEACQCAHCRKATSAALASVE